MSLLKKNLLSLTFLVLFFFSFDTVSAQVPTCTERELRIGLICTKTAVSVAQGCGCGPGLQCQHIGAQFSGLQTIQCVGYLPTGSECSPAGALCGPYSNPGECILVPFQGKYACYSPPTPTPTNTPTPTTAQVVPTEAATPTPNTTDTNGATCSSNGIKSIQYNKSGCYNFREAKSATVICNDEVTKTFTSSFGCTETIRFEVEIQNFCYSHKACPTPTPSPTATPLPTSTPSPTLLATATPTPVVCDPNHDGVTGDLLDYGVWVGEILGSGGMQSDCYHPDRVIDLLDFQGWKDMFLSKLK